MDKRMMVACVSLVVLLLSGAVGAGDLEQADLFVGGTEGYHTYRIPAMVVTGKGTVLAFCEGRKVGQSDAKDIDLLIRREELQTVKRVVDPLGFDVDSGEIPFDTAGPKRRAIHRVSKIEGSEVLTLDLLVVSPALEDVWEDREVWDWEGRRVWVVSVEGLARMKRMAGRRQDLLDLEKLGLDPGGGLDREE